MSEEPEEDGPEFDAMTLGQAEAVVEMYEELCRRAAELHSFDNEEYIRVWFQDDKAYAQSARNEYGYYGDSSIEVEQYSGPIEPYLMSSDEFDAWLKAKTEAEKQERVRQEAARQAAYVIDRERQERALYEALRQKYGKFGIF